MPIAALIKSKRARTMGVTVGHPLRIRIDQYTGPPRRQYIGVPGKSVRLIVRDKDELDEMFSGLVRYLGGRSWRKRSR